MIVILVPCYNEAASLLGMLAELPIRLLGHPVQVLVADDGSADLARRHGATVLALEHTGLAQTFRHGLAAVRRGAACVVVMDGDGQYGAKTRF